LVVDNFIVNLGKGDIINMSTTKLLW